MSEEQKSRKEILREWVKELRSGRWKQADRKLNIMHKETGEEKFCCLGVLCTIHPKVKKVKAQDTHFKGCLEGVYEHEGSTEVNILHSDLIRKLGISPGFHDKLTTMNDDGKSFEEIADKIESHFNLEVQSNE